MAEFFAGREVYRTRRMSAIEQWTLLRRLTPILPALSNMDFGLRLPGITVSDFSALLKPLRTTSDADAMAVFKTCRAACEHRENETWGAVPERIGISALLEIVMAVVAENFGPLFGMERVSFQPIPGGGAAFASVHMPNGEDWFYRPFMRDKCRFEQLRDGTLQIEDVAKINDLIDIADENETRARKAAEQR